VRARHTIVARECRAVCGFGSLQIPLRLTDGAEEEMRGRGGGIPRNEVAGERARLVEPVGCNEALDARGRSGLTLRGSLRSLRERARQKNENRQQMGNQCSSRILMLRNASCPS
jgi:hypothetical protein